jgi:hypothetical protein
VIEKRFFFVSFNPFTRINQHFNGGESSSTTPRKREQKKIENNFAKSSTAVAFQRVKEVKAIFNRFIMISSKI